MSSTRRISERMSRGEGEERFVVELVNAISFFTARLDELILGLSILEVRKGRALPCSVQE